LKYQDLPLVFVRPSDQESMKNIAQILSIAEAGDLAGAHTALDSLLSMGPQNIEALKLRARLLEVAGRFQMEAKVWTQVAKIDRDDADLLQYVARRQSEDRENFYFTDEIPNGGKKFYAFPRQMVRHATIGLVGCLLFLAIARLSPVYPVLNQPIIMLSSFALLVISPWIAILVTYLKSLRFISVTKDGLEICTRFKTHHFQWSAVEQVYLAQDSRHDTYQLSLVVVSREPAGPCFELNFNEESTSIRARSYLVREITGAWGEPVYADRKSIDTQSRRKISA
jgi:hypothetical protein